MNASGNIIGPRISPQNTKSTLFKKGAGWRMTIDPTLSCELMCALGPGAVMLR
jgi:hypothetical protein